MSGWDTLDKVAEEHTEADAQVAAAVNAPDPISTDEARQLEVDRLQKEMAEKSHSTCPKCMWDIRDKVLKAKEEDMQEYTRCLLAPRPFSKELPVLQGALKIGFTENTDAVREDIIRIMRTLEKTLDAKPLTSLEMNTMSHKVQVVYTLTSLKTENKTDSFEVPEVGTLSDIEAVVALFEERFGGRSASSQSILFRAYNEFERLVVVLSEGAFDTDFYQGVGLA
jgi:hypothetical protein